MRRVIMGVVASTRTTPSGPSYFTYLAIGFSASPYYRIVNSAYVNIGAPAAAREVYGFSADRLRSNVMISSVTNSNSQFLNLGTLTLSEPGTALPANPRGSAYSAALDAFVCGTQNTPRATLYDASDFSKIGNLASQPSSIVTYVDQSPNGAYIGMSTESGNRHILYNVPDLSTVAFSGTNLGAAPATISFNKNSDLFSLSAAGPGTRIYTVSGENAPVATLATSGNNNCSVFHTAEDHIFVGTSENAVNYGQIFDYTTGALISQLNTNVGVGISRASYSPDGTLLAVAHGSSYSVFETTGYTRIHGPTSVGSGILVIRFLEAVD